MNEKIKRIAHIIVSCGIQHHFPFAKLLGSLLVLPILFVAHWLYVWFPMATVVAGMIFFSVSLIAFYLVLTEPADHYPVLVLDKIFGLLLTFIAIPLQLKLFLVGFCAFHLLRFAMPFLSKRLFYFDFYRFGNVFNFCLSSLFAGALVNVILRLVLWVVR